MRQVCESCAGYVGYYLGVCTDPDSPHRADITWPDGTCPAWKEKDWMKLDRFAEEVHQNAVAHGWWDEERTFGEIAALCHSELSEALEAYRVNAPFDYELEAPLCEECEREACGIWRDGACRLRGTDRKPEGVGVELAVCIIRILDWYAAEGLDADALLTEAREVAVRYQREADESTTFGEFITLLHGHVAAAYACWHEGHGKHPAAVRLANCIREILRWAEGHGIDMEEILRVKHEYNKGRPYRHGGKTL